jgi:hypothetical protein
LFTSFCVFGARKVFEKLIFTFRSSTERRTNVVQLLGSVEVEATFFSFDLLPSSALLAPTAQLSLLILFLFSQLPPKCR